MNLDGYVKEKVFDFLRSKGEIPGQTDEEQLAYPYLDNGLVDSMGIVEMVMMFEEEFSIHFEPQHMQSLEFRTIGGLIALIEQLMGDESHAYGTS